MTEKDIEKYLRNKVKTDLGGRAYKFVSPGNNGVPDRLIALPYGKAVFVETKAPGKKSTPLQKAQQEKLRRLGFRVFPDVDSREKVNEVVEACRRMGIFQ